MSRRLTPPELFYVYVMFLMGGDTILAEIITKWFLGTIIFVIIFVIITKIIDQNIFFVVLLPLVCPCLQENMRRQLLCKEIAL